MVTQQNENDAVIASGLSASDRVVTTGFANLSDGAKVIIGKDDQTPAADLAPRKRSRGPDGKGGQARTARQGRARGERAARRARATRKGRPDRRRQRGEQSGSGAKSQP